MISNEAVAANLSILEDGQRQSTIYQDSLCTELDMYQGPLECEIGASFTEP
jgi:hypothetical protein